MSAAVQGRDPSMRRRVAWPPVIALGLVSLVAIVALRPVPHAPGSPVVAARALVVTSTADGGLDIRLAGSNALVRHIPGEGDSFARGVFHSLSLLRVTHHEAQDVPYGLAEHADGRLLLTDPGTATAIDIEGFGPNNRAEFVRLLGLPAPEAKP